MTIGANAPYRFDSRQDAAHLVNTLIDAGHKVRWEFKPASFGRTGINSMFNHGPEWWLMGTLGIVLARVPAEVQVTFDGVNIRSNVAR